MSTNIPHSDNLKAEIQARTAELRALRRLLRLAKAQQEFQHARQVRISAGAQGNPSEARRA